MSTSMGTLYPETTNKQFTQLTSCQNSRSVCLTYHGYFFFLINATIILNVFRRNRISDQVFGMAYSTNSFAYLEYIRKKNLYSSYKDLIYAGIVIKSSFLWYTQTANMG